MKIFGFRIEISRNTKAAAAWTATHMHKKGGAYRKLYDGILETDRSAVVIYDDADGQVWVRPYAEFYDGRFSVV